MIEYIKSVAAAKGHCRVYPSGAMTKGLKGEIISEMGNMVEHGCVAFTDDGQDVYKRQPKPRSCIESARMLQFLLTDGYRSVVK